METLGQILDELAVAPLQGGQRPAAAVGKLGEVLLPAGQEGAPAGGRVVGGGGGASVGQLLALYLEDLPQQFHALRCRWVGGGRGGGGRRQGGGHVNLEVHGWGVGRAGRVRLPIRDQVFRF